MTLVFLHIDRTGGMAVREALARQYPREAIRPVPHHRAATWQPHTYPLDFDHDLISQNVNYVHDANHDVVMGHWDAGILDKIPGEKQVMTVLRDPAERAASLWRFICKERNMYGRLSIDAIQMGMVNFLLKYKDLWVNVMTDQLSGARWSGVGNGYLTAVKNIQEFDNVFVTEHLDDYPFIQGWQKATGKRRVNVSADPFGEDIYEMVAEESPLDCKLYQIAKVRCEIELQQSHFG